MLGRMVSLWRQDDWRALFAGITYIVLVTLASQMDWQARLRALRYQYRRQHEGVIHPAVTPAARELAALAGTFGYPFVMLLLGVFSPKDLGLGRPNWGGMLFPLLAGAIGGTVWLAFLWGRDTRAGPALGERPVRSGWSPTILFGALIAEAHLATCRAALMPLVGSYWGIWIGVVLAMLAAQTSPLMQWRLASPVGRRRVYLDWALDWVSTAVLALTGTVWAGLLVRVLCRSTLHVTVLRGTNEAAAAITEPADAEMDFADASGVPDAAANR